MISVSGVSMRFGSKVLFEEVSATFSAGRRYGLTGPNGSGKSTFMKLLTGEVPPQRGSIARPPKVGVLRQDHYAFDEFRVIDTVIMGNARLWQALQDREVLYHKPDLTDADQNHGNRPENDVHRSSLVRVRLKPDSTSAC